MLTELFAEWPHEDWANVTGTCKKPCRRCQLEAALASQELRNKIVAILENFDLPGDEERIQLAADAILAALRGEKP
jgi:hypothetical protein